MSITPRSVNTLKCCKCGGTFDSSDRAPIVLDCFHTFCSRCVKESMHTTDTDIVTIQCEFDGLTTQLSGSSSSSTSPVRPIQLRKNAAVMSRYAAASAATVVKCTKPRCAAADKHAVVWCVTCSRAFCGDCCVIHEDLLDDHVVISIDERIQAEKAEEEESVDVQVIDLKHRVKCSVMGHKSEEVKLFCLSCKTCVCAQCSKDGLHNEHQSQVMDIDKAVAEYKQKLYRLSEQLVAHSGQIQEKAATTRSISKEMGRKSEEVRKQLENEWSELLSLITKHRDALQGELRACVGDVDSRLAHLQMKEMAVNHQLFYLQYLQTRASQHELVQWMTHAAQPNLAATVDPELAQYTVVETVALSPVEAMIKVAKQTLDANRAVVGREQLVFLPGSARHLLCIGGVEAITDRPAFANCWERFDLISRTWTRLAAPTLSSAYQRVCLVEGDIYAIAHMEDLSDAVVSVFKFDSVSNTWLKVGKSLVARVLFGVAVVGKSIFLIGGTDTDGVALSSVHKFNCDDSTWSQMPSLPLPCSAPAVAVCDSTVFVFGCNQGMACSPPDSAVFFDSSANTWTPIEPMLVPRSGCGAATVGTTIYIIGGANSSTGVIEASVEKYDTVSGKWTAVTESLKVPRVFPVTVVANGTVFVLGGATTNNLVGPFTEVFDPQRGTWATFPPMSLPRVFFGAITEFF